LGDDHGRTSTTIGYDVFIAEPIPLNVAELVPNGDDRSLNDVVRGRRSRRAIAA
jgi:hypothetical protein